MRRIEWQFLALDKGIISVAKYNSLFSEKLEFEKNYCPTEAKQVEHYAEGLPAEYGDNVRQCNTLAVIMDKDYTYWSW